MINDSKNPIIFLVIFTTFYFKNVIIFYQFQSLMIQFYQEMLIFDHNLPFKFQKSEFSM